MRGAGTDGEPRGGCRAEDGTNTAAGQERSNPAPCRSSDAEVVELDEQALMPDGVEGLGQVEKGDTAMLARIKSCGHALLQAEERIDRVAAVAVGELVLVEFSFERLEALEQKHLCELAHDGSEADRSVVVRLGLRASFLVERSHVPIPPPLRQHPALQTVVEHRAQHSPRFAAGVDDELCRHVVRPGCFARRQQRNGFVQFVAANGGAERAGIRHCG